MTHSSVHSFPSMRPSLLTFFHARTGTIWLALVWQPEIKVYYAITSAHGSRGKAIQPAHVAIYVVAPFVFQEQVSRLVARHVFHTPPQQNKLLIYRTDLCAQKSGGGNSSGIGSPLLKFVNSIIETDNVASQLEVRMGSIMPALSQNIEDEQRKALGEILPSLRNRLHRWLKTEKMELFLRADHSGNASPLPYPRTRSDRLV